MTLLGYTLLAAVVVLAGLRLLAHMSISWWVVFAPIWGTVAAITVIIVLIATYELLCRSPKVRL